MLARQLLLKRVELGIREAVEALAGLQAQQAMPPFVGLWTRLSAFDPDTLRAQIADGELIRATMMRCTLHLMSAADYRAFRPVLQPMMSASARSVLGRRATEIDPWAAGKRAESFFGAGAKTFAEFREAIADECAPHDPRAFAYLARTHSSLVQVPDDSRWGYAAKARYRAARSFMKKRAPGTLFAKRPPKRVALVQRYLSAFGPASPADMATWSSMRGLRETFETMRDELVVFRGPDGQELFDLPDAPRPGSSTRAPVRFLPAFDNLVLAHADRTRVIDNAFRSRIVTKNLIVEPTFLVNGFVVGMWKHRAKKRRAELTLKRFTKLSKTALGQLEREGDRLSRFLAPDSATHAVVVVD